MSYPVYTVPLGDVLPIFFDTFDGGTGASVTMTGLAVTDIEVYKDGSVTQRASDAGYTLLDTDGIDFDGITGIHGFSIDTGDNTDAGFYAVGAWYLVVVSAITVDAQTVNFIAAAFRIMAAEGVAGVPDVNVTHVGDTAQTAGDLKASLNTIDDFLDTEIAAILAAVDTEVAAILADTNELQTDWVDGGRLDLILDARASQASVDTVDDFLDTEVAAILAAVDTEVAAIKAKTDLLPTATIASGAAVAGTLSTTEMTTDLSEATDDHFNGRTLIWTSGALLQQATNITDYDGATKKLVYTAVTDTPGAGDTFVIV